MKVLLVGGSEHVGSFITPYLRNHHDIRVLDLRPPSHDVEFVEGSIADVDALERALSGADAFVNLVMKSPQGGSSTEQSITVIRDNYKVNNLGLHLLLFTAQRLGVRRGVYTSTMSVHHRNRSWYPAEETVPLDTPSVYGLTKGFGELICGYFAQWFDMNLLALRISAPRTHSQWMEESVSTHIIEGDARLFPIHEEDLANAYLAALRTIQVGNGRFDVVFVVGDEREEQHNLTKARQVLQWRPRASSLHRGSLEDRSG